MTKYDTTELFALVRTMLETTDETVLEQAIFQCHRGRVTFPITNENLHLFRQYRNRVSGNARFLIAEAIADGEPSNAVHALQLKPAQVSADQTEPTPESGLPNNGVLVYRHSPDRVALQIRRRTPSRTNLTTVLLSRADAEAIVDALQLARPPA